jgi:hypothetical protein
MFQGFIRRKEKDHDVEDELRFFSKYVRREPKDAHHATPSRCGT